MPAKRPRSNRFQARRQMKNSCQDFHLVEIADIRDEVLEVEVWGAGWRGRNRQSLLSGHWGENRSDARIRASLGHYHGYAEASTVPPSWHGWLHHTVDIPPTQENYKPRPWQKPHRPNMTGTPGALRRAVQLAARPPAKARRLQGLDARRAGSAREHAIDGKHPLVGAGVGATPRLSNAAIPVLTGHLPARSKIAPTRRNHDIACASYLSIAIWRWPLAAPPTLCLAQSVETQSPTASATSSGPPPRPPADIARPPSPPATAASVLP